MTKVVVIPLVNGKKPSKAEIDKKLSTIYEGAVNKNATYKQGWNPFIQSFVRREGPGNYVVVHNLNTPSYSVSAGLLGGVQASYELSEIGTASFRLTIKKDGEPIASDFRFCICMMD